MGLILGSSSKQLVILTGTLKRERNCTGHHSSCQQLASSRLKVVIPGAWQAMLAQSHTVLIWLTDFFFGPLTKGPAASCRRVSSTAPAFHVAVELAPFSRRQGGRSNPLAISLWAHTPTVPDGKETLPAACLLRPPTPADLAVRKSNCFHEFFINIYEIENGAG